jgi:hypothetical protein
LYSHGLNELSRFQKTTIFNRLVLFKDFYSARITKRTHVITICLTTSNYFGSYVILLKFLLLRKIKLIGPIVFKYYFLLVYSDV